MSYWGRRGTLDQVVESFEFGMGDTVISNRRWTYPVRVAGTWTSLVIFELEGEDQETRDMPALIGLEEIADWEMRLEFSRGRYRAEAVGRAVPLTLAPSGHPYISLVNSEESGVSDERE